MSSTKVTNQQLAFARVQLESADAAASNLTRRAHWQACLLQLDLAFQAYALELAQLSKLKIAVQPGRTLFRQLAEALQTAGLASAQLDEWVRLERDPDSWLAKVQQWALTPQKLDTTGNSVREETTLTVLENQAGAIKLVEISEGGEQAFDPATLRAAVEAAADLVKAQREQNAEY